MTPTAEMTSYGAPGSGGRNPSLLFPAYFPEHMFQNFWLVVGFSHRSCRDQMRSRS